MALPAPDLADRQGDRTSASGHEPSSRLDAINNRDGSSTAAVMRRFGERLLLALGGRACVAQGLPVFEAKRPVTRATGSSARDPSGCSTCKSKATQGDVRCRHIEYGMLLPVIVINFPECFEKRRYM
jgi:hypothetical protein